MEILSQTINNLDVALLSVWLLIAMFWNVRALIILISLCCYLAAHFFTPTDFDTFIICSTLYFTTASLNIKLSFEYRKAFIAFGVIYLLGSIDHFTYSHLHINTQFDRLQPYLLTIINAYVLAYLLSGGRLQGVHGLAYSCFRCVQWFKLHLSRNHKTV
jgi:hypothetical protein